ncbi:hypothetical protein [Neotamlana laminarinivorans]|uniref:Uncharacterized protein n=1 Tax=Neotamlana laminarinivorans TaxID=2883124 RepID=A0A9X1I4E7_9FLAO|nr:hypothetical protein [Tamlana laminarinivorans]MCB4799794.1 hypothetical protein [Tamlana laminarinivorans]
MFLSISIAIMAFLLITFLYWKLTRNYAEKIYGKKQWKTWVSRTYYWHGVLYVSGGLTVLIIFLLKANNLLVF